MKKKKEHVYVVYELNSFFLKHYMIKNVYSQMIMLTTSTFKLVLSKPFFGLLKFLSVVK